MVDIIAMLHYESIIIQWICKVIKKDISNVNDMNFKVLKNEKIAYQFENSIM